MTARYIITRLCLQEGSMRLLKYLQPHFPQDGPIKLYDAAGHEYVAQVSLAQERILGLGDFYRDHHLGVNDVVMVTPLLPGCFKLEAIIKPYARPEPESEAQRRGELKAARGGVVPAVTGTSPARLPAAPRPAADPDENNLRVIVNATPHVREVRVQRSDARPSVWSSMAEEGRRADPPQEWHRAAADGPVASHPVASHPVAAYPGAGHPAPASSAAAGRTLEARHVPAAAEGAVGTGSAGLKVAEARPEARPAVSPVRVTERRTPATPAAETQASAPHVSSPADESRTSLVRGSASAATQRLLRDLHQAPEGVRRPGRTADGAPQVAGKAEVEPSGSSFRPATTERDLLEWPGDRVEDTAPSGPAFSGVSDLSGALDGDPLQELGRLVGYQVDYLSAGLTRLRAELGQHGYQVLIADSGTAATAPEWRERSGGRPTYKVWMTHEGQDTGDAPVVTREAVQMLVSQARMAPLSPLDLRTYWHAGRLDVQAASALSSLAQDHLAARGEMSAVLLALGQHPANSIVSAARLGELLGQPDRELREHLHTLTRPPFLLLTALDNGEYLLRQDIPAALSTLEEYAQGLQRRVQVAGPQPPAVVLDHALDSVGLALTEQEWQELVR